MLRDIEIFRSTKRAVDSVLRIAVIKRVLIDVPVVRKVYMSWERTHPFDQAYNVETSGYVASDKIHADPKVQDVTHPYAPVQPSVIRTILTALGDVTEYTFIDYGCGKGRAILVATEFPFQKIIGVELSSSLADVARRNAVVFAGRFPERTKIDIYAQNVLDYEPPHSNVAIFIYHSFGRPVWAEVLKKLEAGLSAGRYRHLFLIYCNPVFWQGLDASPYFTRWFAKTMAIPPSEVGFGPDKTDTAVIWQSKCGARPSPYPDREAQIIEHHLDWKAGLAADLKSKN
jgi:SAM-dependent methyltransferase